MAKRAAKAFRGCGWMVKTYDLSEPIKLNKKVKHTIEIVVDRLTIPDPTPLPSPNGSQPSNKSQSDANSADDADDSFMTRLTDSIETALRFGDGKVIISTVPRPSSSNASDDNVPPEASDLPDEPVEWLMSETNTCTTCGFFLPRADTANVLLQLATGRMF